MKYQTQDGDRYEATTPAALVKQMMKGSFDTQTNVAEYMASVASRTMRQNGTHIVHDTPETFVASLIGAGLLEQVEE